MSYLDFVIQFLLLPIVVLVVVTAYWRWKKPKRPYALSAYSIPGAVGLISLIAVVYTTPWDNYLVAERIWWYDPSKVLGTWGYVPIEEYAFFVLQVVLSGLVAILMIGVLSRKKDYAGPYENRKYQIVGAGGLIIAWLAIFVAEQAGWLPGRYFALLTLWSLPPLALQLAFGADILWPHRLPIALTLLVMTAYLVMADGLAINAGIWTINPDEVVGIYLWERMPLEEALFFFMTNALIVCGVPLCLAPETWRRLAAIFDRRRSVTVSSAK